MRLLHVLELDRGKLKSYPGNYEDYIAMRAENEVIEQNNKKSKSFYKQESCMDAYRRKSKNDKTTSSN